MVVGYDTTAHRPYTILERLRRGSIVRYWAEQVLIVIDGTCFVVPLISILVPGYLNNVPSPVDTGQAELGRVALRGKPWRVVESSPGRTRFHILLSSLGGALTFYV